jgi:hypothetical protein
MAPTVTGAHPSTLVLTASAYPRTIEIIYFYPAISESIHV